MLAPSRARLPWTDPSGSHKTLKVYYSAPLQEGIDPTAGRVGPAPFAEETIMRHPETPWKFVLLGGDGQTAANYKAAAALEGHHLDHFTSMHDVGYLGRIREYDAAIVHDAMHPLSGLELAEYLEKLFESLPMILLTQDDENSDERPCLPASVVGSYPASQEAHIVMQRAIHAVRSPGCRALVLT